MKNPERWSPSKYVIERGRLRASRSRRHVAAGSWLVTDLVAAQYDFALREYCRGDVLDLGCGEAPLYGHYRRFASSVTCVDWPGSAHDTGHADVLCDLDEPLPLPDASFDTVILSDVLEHLYDPRQVISEIRRVLRPGGKLLMSAPFMYGLHERPHDYYRYTRHTLERMASDSGFDVLLLQELGGGPEVLADVTGKLLGRIRFLGPLLASFVQRGCRWWSRTRLGARASAATAGQFPLEYFLVAQRRERCGDRNEAAAA
jgi:SAM-dependent methyltransferase